MKPGSIEEIKATLDAPVEGLGTVQDLLRETLLAMMGDNSNSLIHIALIKVGLIEGTLDPSETEILWLSPRERQRGDQLIRDAIQHLFRPAEPPRIMTIGADGTPRTVYELQSQKSQESELDPERVLKPSDLETHKWVRVDDQNMLE